MRHDGSVPYLWSLEYLGSLFDALPVWAFLHVSSRQVVISSLRLDQSLKDKRKFMEKTVFIGTEIAFDKRSASNFGLAGGGVIGLILGRYVAIIAAHTHAK